MDNVETDGTKEAYKMGRNYILAGIFLILVAIFVCVKQITYIPNALDNFCRGVCPYIGAALVLYGVISDEQNSKKK